MAYKNRNGVAITNAEAALEQWAGRPVMDSVSGKAAVTDVSAKATAHIGADKEIRRLLNSGRSE